MKIHWLLMAAAFMPSPQAMAFDPRAGSLAKEDARHLRLMTYNVFNQFPTGNPTQTAAHERILRAIQPDVIVFQEMDPGIGIAVRIRLQQILGPPWYIHEGQASGPNVNVLASRHPLSLQRVDTDPASGPRGVTMAMVDLPDEAHDLDIYIMGVHLQCCTGATQDASRQYHADAIASWVGRVKSGAAPFVLAPQTPMVILGDVNFNSVAAPGPRATLMQGTIQNTGVFGPPIRPDWDGSDLAEGFPLDPFTLRQNTFASNTATPTVQLDRFYYTDSVARAAHGFVLNTLTIPSATLPLLGLQATDTQTASDHLPVVVDFAIGNPAATAWCLR